MRRHGGAANRADRVMEDLQKAKSWSVDQMFGAAKKRPQSAPAPVVAAAPAQAAAPVSEPATSSKLEWEWEATTVQCQMARLKVYREEDHMSTIDLSVKTGYLVGRQKIVCDIVVDHVSMSRKHAAMIHHSDGRVFLIDLGSMQGSWVDGAQLEPNVPHELKNGTSIVFGAAPRRYVFMCAKITPGEIAREPGAGEGKPKASLVGLMGNYGSDEDDDDNDTEPKPAASSAAPLTSLVSTEDDDDDAEDDDEEGTGFGWAAAAAEDSAAETSQKKRPLADSDAATAPPAKRRKRVTFAMSSELVRVYEVEKVACILERMGADGEFADDLVDDEQHEEVESESSQRVKLWVEGQQISQVTANAQPNEDQKQAEQEANLFGSLASLSREGEVLRAMRSNIKENVSKQRWPQLANGQALSTAPQLAGADASVGELSKPAPVVGQPSSEGQGGMAMEWFCDLCDECISGVRFECRTCPEEFCMCPACYATKPHPHQLISNSGACHITLTKT